MLSLGFASLSLVSQTSFAQDPPAAAEQQEAIKASSSPEKTTAVEKNDEVDTLPEVNVKDSRLVETPFSRTQPVSTVTSEELARNQPSNIFDAVRAIPGVSISGGPRPSGMTFSIRGYADNEDVLVKVDGVPKGFEKYRMGGTFIEPELLKSIEVQRGPQIASGSGSLGGTIIATTKSAEDFLKPGQKYGAKAKFAYGSNNDEYARSYMLYGRPDERLDILYNYSNRQSNNLTLGDGNTLDNSAIVSISHLLKVSIFPTEDLQLVTSVVKFEDTGLQPYDATGGQPGSFGTVIRSVDDLTWSESVQYDPAHPWIHLKAAVGAGHTDLTDHARPGMSDVMTGPVNASCDGTVYLPDPNNTTLCRGGATDTYQYKTRTVDISNTAQLLEKGFLNIALLAGYQYNYSEREITRFYDNRLSSAQLNQYPNGFNASAPPGIKAFHALYMQPTFEIGPVTVIPGYRQDRYEIEAEGGTLALLAPFRQEKKVKFSEETWSLGLAYDWFAKNNPSKLTFYTNYAQGFRPPLIDEYFTQGAFSRCRPAIMPTVGPASRICGDLYQPQRAETTEAGISYQNPHVLDSDVWFSGKINFFHINTSHSLLSLREVSGEVTQDGWERRNGLELESFMQYHGWYLRGSYSRIKGELYNGYQYAPLFTAPGNAVNVNIGTEITKDLDINLSYRRVANREVLLSGDGTASSRYMFGTQEGYELWNAGVRWKASEHVTLRLIGENLKNELYRLDGTLGGIGIYGPGRNVKFLVELLY